jgi:hypothetical protein
MDVGIRQLVHKYLHGLLMYHTTVFTFCPPGSDLGCNPAGVPAPGVATATDACSTPLITSSLGAIISNGCHARADKNLYSDRWMW